MQPSWCAGVSCRSDLGSHRQVLNTNCNRFSGPKHLRSMSANHRTQPVRNQSADRSPMKSAKLLSQGEISPSAWLLNDMMRHGRTRSKSAKRKLRQPHRGEEHLRLRSGTLGLSDLCGSGDSSANLAQGQLTCTDLDNRCSSLLQPCNVRSSATGRSLAGSYKSASAWT